MLTQSEFLILAKKIQDNPSLTKDIYTNLSDEDKILCVNRIKYINVIIEVFHRMANDAVELGMYEMSRMLTTISMFLTQLDKIESLQEDIKLLCNHVFPRFEILLDSVPDMIKSGMTLKEIGSKIIEAIYNKTDVNKMN
jgi:hypothetical protein